MHQKDFAACAALLTIAADHFAEHCANDLPPDFWDNWTLTERQCLVQKMYQANGTPEEYDPEHLDVPDWWLMSYYASVVNDYLLLRKRC